LRDAKANVAQSYLKALNKVSRQMALAVVVTVCTIEQTITTNLVHSTGQTACVPADRFDTLSIDLSKHFVERCPAGY
jgi:hypothetical protein